MRYFGPSKLKEGDKRKVAAPIGVLCIWCQEPIGRFDMGTINDAEQVLHYECAIRGVVGSVGHQRGTCSCFGGTEEDPPGLTKREAAIAALVVWKRDYLPPSE